MAIILKNRLMCRKFFIILIFHFSLLSWVNAQTKSLERGDALFKKFDYPAALDKYLIADKQRVSPYYSTIQIAHCYRFMGDKKQAATWYQKAAGFPDFERSILYYLGQISSQLDDKELAAKYYAAYFNLPGTIPFLMTKDYQTLMDYLRQKGSNASVSALAVNSKNSDIGPVLFNDDFFFASNRSSKLFVKHLDARNKLPFFDVYHVDVDMKDKPVLAPKSFNTVLNDGPVAFSPDGTMAFITRNDDRKVNENVSGIFISIMEHGHFSEDVVPLPVNGNDYSVIHPCMSPDGKRLWFASDKPGGVGGFDIYYSDLKTGFWSEPVNAGRRVNSLGNEVFPFIGTNGLLYFASDGHPGMGGFDLFNAFPDPEDGEWTSFNMGAPLNSSYDDFGIFYKSGSNTLGYFVSNRPGGSGSDDIYKFELFQSPHFVKVAVDISLEDQTPLADVMVAVIKDSGKIFNELRSDANGHVSFYIPADESFSLSLRKKLYQNREIILQPSRLQERLVKLTVEMQKK
jgi:hypothetical protein